MWNTKIYKNMQLKVIWLTFLYLLIGYYLSNVVGSVAVHIANATMQLVVENICCRFQRFASANNVKERRAWSVDGVDIPVARASRILCTQFKCWEGRML